MQINTEIKEFILKEIFKEKNKKIGIEIETFYTDNKLNRISVSPNKKYSALKFFDEIKKKNNNSSYSLEPGGQLEWASSPNKNLWDIHSEYQIHQKIEKEILIQNNLNKLQVSVDPLNDARSIDLINAPKYQLMANYLKQKGHLSHWMMRNTTSVQVNIDYSSENDANQMAFIADNIQPLYSILFSNAPFINGKMAGDRNLRWEIWENTDPDRCGSLFTHGLNKINTYLDDYIAWLLGQPSMYRVDSNGNYFEFNGTILDSIDKSDNISNQINVLLHQSFTNVRFKSFLEIRSPDRPIKGYEISSTAFMAGILTSPSAKDKTIQMIMDWSDSDKSTLLESAFSLSYSNPGPKGKMIGYYLEKIAEIAIEGLDERSRILGIKNERSLLEELLIEILSKGPKTIQLQNNFKKSGLSLKRFIKNILTY